MKGERDGEMKEWREEGKERERETKECRRERKGKRETSYMYM